MKKGVLAIAALALAIALIASTVYAAETSTNKFAEFWRKLFNYPAGVARETVETAATATKGTADTVVKTSSAVADTVTGQPERVKDIVVEPVKGVAETTVNTTEKAVKIPVDAAQEQ